jgi:hypothetical protein
LSREKSRLEGSSNYLPCPLTGSNSLSLSSLTIKIIQNAPSHNRAYPHSFLLYTTNQFISGSSSKVPERLVLCQLNWPMVESGPRESDHGERRVRPSGHRIIFLDGQVYSDDVLHLLALQTLSAASMLFYGSDTFWFENSTLQFAFYL